jgi:AcrR family transcriptional regulator
VVRKRSVEAHSKVLEAAENLFAERGIDATSMDAIAAESGVSKATIYKHWADKDQLALEVLSHLHGLDQEPKIFNSGDLRADLIAQLSYYPAEERAKVRERIMPHLIAYSARNPVFGTTWRQLVIDHQRQQIGKLLQRGIGDGKLEKNLDLDIGIALLFGPMLYRRIFVDGKREKAPAEFIEGVVDAFYKAFGGKTVSAKASKPSLPFSQKRNPARQRTTFEQSKPPEHF